MAEDGRGRSVGNLGMHDEASRHGESKSQSKSDLSKG